MNVSSAGVPVVLAVFSHTCRRAECRLFLQASVQECGSPHNHSTPRFFSDSNYLFFLLFFSFLFCSRLDNGKYADLRFECVLPEVQKMLWSTKGKREGENKRGGGYAERATFHKGLEHFVKYNVFTKNEFPHRLVGRGCNANTDATHDSNTLI